MNQRFPGQQYDSETGLHYNHNRYYFSDLGIYGQPDLLDNLSRNNDPQLELTSMMLGGILPQEMSDNN